MPKSLDDGPTSIVPVRMPGQEKQDAIEQCEAACRQLRAMVSVADKYRRAYNAMITAGKIVAVPQGWESVEA